uniref:Uncharacterized protein n=1 Tax=Anguilla anguilla TaxID=7936 RepID=A0A0E9UIE0_ANGAN
MHQQLETWGCYFGLSFSNTGLQCDAHHGLVPNPGSQSHDDA